jgi:hypothetical protein
MMLICMQNPNLANRGGLPDTLRQSKHSGGLLVSPAACCMLLHPPLKRPAPWKGCRSNTPSQPQATKPVAWYLTTQKTPATHTEPKLRAGPTHEIRPLRGLVTINLAFAVRASVRVCSMPTGDTLKRFVLAAASPTCAHGTQAPAAELYCCTAVNMLKQCGGQAPANQSAKR